METTVQYFRWVTVTVVGNRKLLRLTLLVLCEVSTAGDGASETRKCKTKTNKVCKCVCWRAERACGHCQLFKLPLFGELIGTCLPAAGDRVQSNVCKACRGSDEPMMSRLSGRHPGRKYRKSQCPSRSRCSNNLQCRPYKEMPSEGALSATHIQPGQTERNHNVKDCATQTQRNGFQIRVGLHEARKHSDSRCRTNAAG